MKTRYRTHTCGQLRIADVEKEVSLAGWVHSYRDQGNLDGQRANADKFQAQCVKRLFF